VTVSKPILYGFIIHLHISVLIVGGWNLSENGALLTQNLYANHT